MLSILLFIASLAKPCYCTPDVCNDSVFIVLFGAMGFFLSWGGLAWLANPLLLASWITNNKYPKTSFVTSLLASVFALSFLLFSKVMDNEEGDLRQIVSYQAGYWLWVWSSLIMLIYNSILMFLNRNQKVKGSGKRGTHKTTMHDRLSGDILVDDSQLKAAL
jgi:hypothetical protein